MFILIYEVSMRYVFNAPTIWVYELCGIFYGVFFLLGGAYAELYGAHIRVDFFYAKYSTRTKAVVSLLAQGLFYLFVGALMVVGAQGTWDSIIHMDHTDSLWGPPVWPKKLFVFLGALFFILQMFTNTVSDLFTAVTGERPKFALEIERERKK